MPYGQLHYPLNMYPENMCSTTRLYIINAPQVFSLGWSVVSGVLNKSTIDNVCIRSDDGGSDLLHAVGGSERLAQMLASVPG